MKKKTYKYRPKDYITRIINGKIFWEKSFKTTKWLSSNINAYIYKYKSDSNNF